MRTQWSAWLAAEAAALRGGVVWSEPLVNGLPWKMVLPFPLDMTGDAFKMAFAPSPDATALVTLTVGSGITIGSFTGGFTTVTFRLSDTHVATIRAAQNDADGDGLAEVLADIIWQDGGSGDWRRIFAVAVPISGKIADD
jgi:hypothetical protein